MLNKKGRGIPISHLFFCIWEAVIIDEGRRLMQWFKFHKHNESLDTKQCSFVSAGSEVSCLQPLNKTTEFIRYHGSRMWLPAVDSHNKPTGVL